MKLYFPFWLLDFIGNLYFHNRFPYIILDPPESKIKGDSIRIIEKYIRPGDILLTHHERYLSSILLDGPWGHAGIYVGDNKVIHSTGEDFRGKRKKVYKAIDGVREDDIIDFCQVDGIVLLRIIGATEKNIEYAIDIAKKSVGCMPYDYRFDNNNGMLYCTELVSICYPYFFKADYTNNYGHLALTPLSVYKSSNVKKIIEFIG